MCKSSSNKLCVLVLSFDKLHPRIGCSSILDPKMKIRSINRPMMNMLRYNISRRCPRVGRRHSRVCRLKTLIWVLHRRLSNWRNLHMNGRSWMLIFSLGRHFSNYRHGVLARLLCKSYQLLIKELLNFGFQGHTDFYRVPHVSNIVSTRGIRIMLRKMQKPGRLDLFGTISPAWI